MVAIQWKNRANQKYMDELCALRDELERNLKASLPTLDQACLEAFRSSCQAVQSANTSQKDAQALLEKLQNAETKDPEAIQEATRALQDAKAALADAMDCCMKVGVDTIIDKDLKALLSPEYNDSDLILYNVLAGKCKDLARWIDQNEAWADKTMAGLKNPQLMRLFQESGGARNGQWGAAIRNYYELGVEAKQHDSVLYRLALACALELADPYPLFNGKGVTDAKQRYVHYEQAYLLGELDPSFSQFNVWELRQVVNSDATEEELSWGRQCLQNYRPDIVVNNDAQWQYCFIVRTDVGYNAPDWYKPVRSYDQILSGGGKCGPRAWYGRFICKAYGIPTWGCQQPGHAAMVRWTRNGWCVCLGGGMWKSFWGNQGGPDFELEVTARSACGSERVWLQKVLRLKWISAFYNEDVRMVRSNGLPDPKSPWQSLDMMQRRRLGATCGTNKNQPMFPRANIDRNRVAQITALHQAGAVNGDPVTRSEATGAIVIPASSCSSPGGKQKKVSFLPSFSGGQQLFVQQDATVEFTLALANVPPGRYKLTCCVCTVHRFEKPILLTVTLGGEKDPTADQEVKLPYTAGLWEETEAVTIEVGASTKLHFARPQQPYGFSFKELRLVPV